VRVDLAAADERYRLLVVAAGRPAQHGWWGSEAVARRKFAAWIGDWGAGREFGSAATVLAG
jgi:hypothetical protein